MLAIPYPAIDPVLIEFGPLAIRWYSLAYIAGILIGWRYMVRMARRADAGVEPADIDDFVVWATLGVVLGGRLGYVLFYQPGYYLAHPSQIVAMWKGGMSFHGGALGVFVALLLFCRRRRIGWLAFADLVTLAAPVGLFFGRIANFINGELYGRVSDVPWAMVFPHGGPLPRHPSQLYEATLEGLVLFALLALLAFRFGALRRPGTVSGAFLLCYGLARTAVEFVREPDAFLGVLGGIATMGQILSLPVAAAGLWLILRARPLTLGARLAQRIRRHGPIPVSDYMASALGDAERGYYRTRDPLGADGDFVTAPEISQAFGEMIGLWCADTWRRSGAPDPVLLVELGPGRGTMMADMLRAARALPEFAAALRIHLVETSPALREKQRAALAGRDVAWHDDLDGVPPGPMLLVANEFLDALPVDQYVRAADGWHERRVGLDDAGALSFVTGPALDPGEAAKLIPRALADAAPGALFERSEAVADVAARLGARIGRDGIAALVVDYGHARSAPGETLQAVRDHRYHDVLAAPGDADLTAHVDFAAFARAAAAAGCAVHGPVPQGAFLSSLGIAERTERLAANATGEQAALLRSGCERLTGDGRMGTLFKAVALTRPGEPAPAGFDSPAGGGAP